MFELIKKSIYLGLGLLNVTKEKAEEIVNDLVKRGEVTEGEAKKMVDKILKEAEEQQKKIEQIIEERIRKVLSGMGLATTDDIARLEQKIDKLLKK